MPAYKRILLKLSGEALMGDDAYGINRATIVRMVREVQEVTQLGCEVAVVIGGGNIFRGVAGGSVGMDRATADYMGMLATVMNALALADTMRQEGMTARVMSAIASSRWSSPTCGPRRCSTWKKARSSSSPPAPATPSSPPTPRPRCAAPRSAPRSCSRRPRSTASTAPTPRRTRRATRYAQHQLRRGHRQEPAGDGRHRLRAVPRPEAADQGVQHLQARRAEARGAWARTKAPWCTFDGAVMSDHDHRRHQEDRRAEDGQVHRGVQERAAQDPHRPRPPRAARPGARRLLRLDGADQPGGQRDAARRPHDQRAALGKGHGRRRSRRRSASPTWA